MPFKSEKQRRFMFARHPEIAKRWTKKYGSEPRGNGGTPTKSMAAPKPRRKGVRRAGY